MNLVELLYGLVITLIIGIILGFLLGMTGVLLGLFVSTLIVGFRVSCDVVEGALYGALVAFLTGIIFIGAMVIMFNYQEGLGSRIMDLGLTSIILGLIVNGLIGSIGGLSGSYIRHWRLRCDFKP